MTRPPMDERSEKDAAYVMIVSCEGRVTGGYYADLEMCLQAAAEDIFGEVPDHEHEEWRQIEKDLTEDGFVRFEDGSITIAKAHQTCPCRSEPERRCGLCTDDKPCNFAGCPDDWESRSEHTPTDLELAREVVNEFHRRGNTGLTQLERDIVEALAALRKEFIEAAKGVPETLRQSADLLEDTDDDDECPGVRAMADRLERAIKK